jgi:hypothetical protein
LKAETSVKEKFTSGLLTKRNVGKVLFYTRLLKRKCLFEIVKLQKEAQI